MRGTALVFPVFVLYVVTIGRVSMTATDAALIALGERFEKLLLEHMDAWLEWAPRMRAAHATPEVLDRRSHPFRVSPTRQDRDPVRAERRLEAHGKQHQGDTAGGRDAGEGRIRDRA